MQLKRTVRRASEKRFVDCPPVYSTSYQLERDGILVRCPKCGGNALLRGAKGNYRLICNRCHHSEPRSGSKPLVAAQGCCTTCGRWFNLRLPPAQSTYPRVKAVCPHCKTAQTAQVHPIGFDSTNPLDGLDFYLQAPYRGHIVWALNRAHLNYLIAYVEAELREKYVYSNNFGNWFTLTNGQAKELPRWLKAAKNRSSLLRVLYRMRTLYSIERRIIL